MPLRWRRRDNHLIQHSSARNAGTDTSRQAPLHEAIGPRVLSMAQKTDPVLKGEGANADRSCATDPIPPRLVRSLPTMRACGAHKIG
jgi:hypothetical protein